MSNVYGAEHSSIHTAKLVEACLCETVPTLYTDFCPACRLPQKEPQRTAIPSREHMIPGVTHCLLYQKNIHFGAICQDTKASIHDAVPPGILSATPPHRLHGYRKYDRIRGIEEIARYSRGPSSSELTARRRRVIEHAAETADRHSEHFRVYPPPPPCRLIQVGPQAGVPIAPVTPCNPGTQRVD